MKAARIIRMCGHKHTHVQKYGSTRTIVRAEQESPLVTLLVQLQVQY